MASRQRRLGSVTALVLLSLSSYPVLAAPPAASDPSPDLLAATQVLDRLMAEGSIAAPITLIVRPFRGVVCPSPTADPVTLSGKDSSPQPASSSGVCLSGFELPPLLRQGFFVPFVVALQRQAAPESDPQRPSAAIEESTILLNATGLELVRQVSPPGKRWRDEPALALPPAATCRVALEFAALQLNQPRQRRESFDRIHTRLAERISTKASLFPKGYGSLPPFPDLLGWAVGISGLNRGHWLNARLAESPYWQVLLQHAPGVVTALKDLRGLNEAGFIQAWGQVEGLFGIAAQEREEVIEEQRNQAQPEALRLMAAAGIDPRSCADVFVPASTAMPDEAVLKVYEQAPSKGAHSGPSLPRRFLPAEQKVVIYPRYVLPGKVRSDAGPQAAPPGQNPQTWIQGADEPRLFNECEGGSLPQHSPKAIGTWLARRQTPDESELPRVSRFSLVFYQ